jgi:GxxExxY protein
LAEELRRVGVPFERQVVVSLDYDEVHLDRVYRADFVVSREVLLEIKSVDRLAPVHTSQVVTYLKLLQLEHGIILNFNVRRMKDGIRSVLLTRDRHETTERHRDKRG